MSKLWLSLATVGCLLVTSVNGLGAEPLDAGWLDAEQVFTAKVNRVVAGPVGLSSPPLRTFRVGLVVEKVFRGTVKAGENIPSLGYSIQSEAEPNLPVEQVYVIAASFVQKAWVIDRIELATPALVEQLATAASFPFGWSQVDGKWQSPWAKVKGPHWTAPTDPAAKVCSVLNRPVLLVGAQPEFAVASVPSKTPIEWTNPDGDGDYKITVTNPTDKPLLVPALLTDGKQIRWENSLVILCQGKAYPCPGYDPQLADLKSVTLQPGEKVSFTVNLLKLQGPEWPQGGYRIEFGVCLGERLARQSFYFMTRHHEPLRQKLLGK